MPRNVQDGKLLLIGLLIGMFQPPCHEFSPSELAGFIWHHDGEGILMNGY